LTDAQRDEEDLLMAVYAAMIDRLDRGVGRVLDALDSLGVAESTLVIFFSDNGGCCWSANRTPALPPGPSESGRSYDTEWANVSNTPFRLYKQQSHEGGVSTPCIVRWPGVVRPGTITREVAHLIDLMPTFVEVAGAKYPERFADHPVLPLEGRSLTPILRGGSRPDAPIFWEYVGNRAVRRGKWKLVAERSKGWELYDVVADRCELHDLSERHPAVASELAELYDAWAARTGARTNAQGKSMQPSTQTRYLEPSSSRR
jgi:arylsulfatase